MSDDRKDVPSANAPNWAQRMTETMRTYMGKTGNVLDRGVTMRDLVDAGIADFRGTAGRYLGLKPGTGILGGGPAGGGGGGGGGADPYEPDLTPPPTPTGFTIAAAISNVFIEHDDPIYGAGHGHARTVVYGAIYTTGALPTFADAVEITQFTGTVFAYPTNPATTWHLWIKWESVDGVLSAAPAGGTNGQAVTTGQDVTALVKALTGAGKPFTVLNVPTVIDGVTFPAGIYSTNAFLVDLQVTNAKLGNLAVDNAKIANLSVSKLTAGSIAVGQYIQSTGFISGSSGWRIHANGAAEFSDAIVRGAVYATTGTFTGTVSASTINGGTINGTTVNASVFNGGAVNSTTLNSAFITSGALDIQGGGSNVGDWGYARSLGKWWRDGVNGWVFARAGSDGTTIANIKSGECEFWMASWGDAGIKFPGILMTNGGLTIDQVDVIKTLTIQGNAVTVPIGLYTAGVVQGNSSPDGAGNSRFLLHQATVSITDWSQAVMLWLNIAKPYIISNATASDAVTYVTCNGNVIAINYPPAPYVNSGGEVTSTGNGTWITALTHYPGPGVFTYQMWIFVPGNPLGPLVRCENPGMQILLARR